MPPRGRIESRRQKSPQALVVEQAEADSLVFGFDVALYAGAKHSVKTKHKAMQSRTQPPSSYSSSHLFPPVTQSCT